MVPPGRGVRATRLSWVRRRRPGRVRPWARRTRRTTRRPRASRARRPARPEAPSTSAASPPGRGVRVRGLLDCTHCIAQGCPRLASGLQQKASLTGDLVPVTSLQGPGDLPVISFEGHPRGVRHLFAHQRAARTDERVAAADVAFQEREGQARIDGLHPEAHLADLDRQRVHVDAVDASADDVAQRGLIVVRRGRTPRPDASDAVGEPARRREQEVPPTRRRGRQSPAPEGHRWAARDVRRPCARTPDRGRSRAEAAPARPACNSCRSSSWHDLGSRRCSRRRRNVRPW